MSCFSGPEISNNGLVCMLDASNSKSYNPAENLFTYSQTFTSGWSQSTATIIGNTTSSPIGTQTASTITEDTTTNQHLITQSLGTITSGSVYTLSVYAKAGTRTQISLTSWGEGYAAFNLSTGAVIQTGGNVCSIIDVGNGWYRISATITKTNTNGAFYIIMWNGSNNYLGTGAYQYIWGAQLNKGNYLRPYTATTSSIINATTNWIDISGNNNNASMVNSPLYNNGVMQFDGTNYAFNTLNLSSGTSTVIAGARYSGATRNRVLGSINNNWLLGYHANLLDRYYANGWVYTGSVASDTNWRIYSGTADVTADVFNFYNGINLLASNNLGAGGPNGIQIGGGYNTTTQLSTCEVSFVLAYNRVLTSEEVTQVFNAYRGRFGI